MFEGEPDIITSKSLYPVRGCKIITKKNAEVYVKTNVQSRNGWNTLKNIFLLKVQL